MSATQATNEATGLQPPGLTDQGETWSAEDRSQRFARSEALLLAERFVTYLDLSCTRCVIAGSLRRRKESVKDIEILFVPKLITAPDLDDMFGGTKSVPATDARIDALLGAGIIEKRPNKNGGFTWGPENKLARHCESGIPVDLFATDEDRFWMALFVRTGPAELNTRVASLAIERGWKLHAYGNGFTCARPRPRPPVRVKSERDVFAHVGLDYLEPWERSSGASPDTSRGFQTRSQSPC